MTRTQTYWNCHYWLDLGNNADSGQFVLGQPENQRNKARDLRLPTAPELFPELINAKLDKKDRLPPCSALEALERQEPFVNQTLAYQALAMLARLFRYGRVCTQSSGTLSRAMTSSAQVGDRYARGSNQETDPLPWMLAPNRSPELHCFFGSLAHVQQYQIEKIRHPKQLCFRDAFGCVHVNSAASQDTGAQLLHRFVAVDDEHVFRANLKGNRRLLGHRTPPSLLEAGVSESSYL